jgi:hypothetical protein
MHFFMHYFVMNHFNKHKGDMEAFLLMSGANGTQYNPALMSVGNQTAFNQTELKQMHGTFL